MFNIFKKKEQTLAPTNYSSSANYSSAPKSSNSTSLWKPKTVQQSFQSLFSSPAPKVQNYSKPQTGKPVSTSISTYSQKLGPASPQKISTYSEKLGPALPPNVSQSAPQNPQMMLMDNFLSSQRGTADQKKKTAGDLYNAGNQYREGTYNAQREQLLGMKGDATDAFNQFEQGTLGSIERIKGQGERNKANTEDYYGDAQRTAAQARRETQGDAQRRFSALNTIDSFGEGSFKQANENIDSDFNRLTQQFAREKANKLAEIDDQVFSAQQTAEQSIQSERIKLQQVLRQIDGTLQQGTMEHKFAQDQAMAQYQETVAGIEDWFTGVKYETEGQKLALQQQLQSMSSFTPEFMATGVPSNQQEYEFLIKNQDTFSKLYPSLFDTTGGQAAREKGEIIDLVDRVLDTDTNNLTGTVRLGSLYSSKARDTKALVDQIKAKLALNEREKLKGQGTITDSETAMLEKAVTSLNYPMSDTAFRAELNNIKAALQGQGGVGSRASGVDNMSLVSQYGG